MKRSKQQGFGAVAIIAAVVVLAVVVFVGWRIYDASQPADTNNQPTNSNNQPGNTNQPSQTQTDPNEGYVVIKEWGVRFKPVDGLTGVQYYKVGTNSEFFAFTTEALAQADPNCAAASGNIALAGITRSKDAAGTGKQHGPINDYYYYTRASGAACSTNPNDLEGPVVSKLLQSLDTLEAAK